MCIGIYLYRLMVDEVIYITGIELYVNGALSLFQG